MKLITQTQFTKAKCTALFVFTFFVAKAFGGPIHNQASSFKLMLPSNGEHTIIIDNIPYTGVYDYFTIDNLRTGHHRLKIIKIFVSKRGRFIERTVLYNGMVYMPHNAKVWASISNNGRFIIEKTYHRNYNPEPRGRNKRFDTRDCDHTNLYKHNPDTREGKRDAYHDDDWYGYEDRMDETKKEGQRDQKLSGNDHMRNDESFAYTLTAIKKQSFDNDRLKIAKNAVAHGTMLSREVAELTKLFAFESSRLEFAKYAYTYTIDKQNYVIVQDAFHFSSSTSELQDFIAKI